MMIMMLLLMMMVVVMMMMMNLGVVGIVVAAAAAAAAVAVVVAVAVVAVAVVAGVAGVARKRWAVFQLQKLSCHLALKFRKPFWSRYLSRLLWEHSLCCYWDLPVEYKSRYFEISTDEQRDSY